MFVFCVLSFALTRKSASVTDGTGRHEQNCRADLENSVGKGDTNKTKKEERTVGIEQWEKMED